MKKEINLGYIHMSSYKKGKNLFPDDYNEVDTPSPDEIILSPDLDFELKIDYPLDIPFVCKINTTKNGLTRRNVVEIIIKCYKQIYKEEDKSTEIKVGRANSLLNRNQTDGKYGIWGMICQTSCFIHL